MARISQRAMNNVVIVAMLLMIALFNIDSFLPKQDIAQYQSLLPQDVYVLKIEHDENSLERSGQIWRQRTGDTALSVPPDRQFSAWQQAMLEPISGVPQTVSSMQPLVVVVWVAGQANGLVYGFYPSTSPTVVKYDGNWYTLTNAELDTLLPWKH